MKTKKSLLAIGLAICVCMPLSAQITVQSDGGVKIGTKPKNIVGLTGNWELESKGLEISIGDILLHTGSGGSLRFATTQMTIGSKSANQDIVVNPGLPGNPGLAKQVSSVTMTGDYLSFGTTDNYAHNIFVTNLTSLNHTHTPSDVRYKENIKNIPDVTDKVMQLRPVFYDLKTPKDYIDDTMRLKNRVGFIAQEVELLFPELVNYLPEPDMYTLDYTSFIPYLTRVIQTQENTIAEQEERIAALERIVSDLIAQQQEGNSPKKTPAPKNRMSAATLYQNMPNPFSEQTTISYELPERVSSAKILIHSLDGQLIKTYPLSANVGLGYISVDAGMLSPGMYTYSLSVNNRMVDTKRMVVTE